jgi:anti-sigma B factor antagonist
MSHLECPNCRLKISALGAPLNCPRCLIRSGQRVELVPAPMFLARPERRARSARSAQIQPFGLSVGELRPGCLKIEVQGELDLAVTDRLTEALAGAAEYRQVLLDLARCDFVDSTAVAAILRAEWLLALEGRRIVVVGPQGQVLRVLTVMGLTDHGLVFASAEEALSASPVVVAA